MKSKVLKILMIDKDKNTLEIECDIHLFRQLNKKHGKVQTHKSMRQLHATLDNFLKDN